MDSDEFVDARAKTLMSQTVIGTFVRSRLTWHWWYGSTVFMYGQSSRQC